MLPSRSGDPWAVLGLDQGATRDEIRAAYRARSLLLHPDLHTERSDAVRREAERAMGQLSEAYETLMGTSRDPDRRPEGIRRTRGRTARFAYRLGWIAGTTRRTGR